MTHFGSKTVTKSVIISDSKMYRWRWRCWRPTLCIWV